MTNEREDLKGLLSALGLCARARGLIFGVPQICDAMRSGGKNKPLVVIEASDTSENTHKKINDKCSFYGVRHTRIACDGATLAAALGKTASLAAVAITDGSLLRLAEKYIQETV